MNFLRSIILFLCDQKKWLVLVGIIFSQFLVAADIESLIISPQIEARRPLLGIIALELLACFVITPSLLLFFRIIARFAALLGTMRAVMLTIAVIVVEELLTKTEQNYIFIAPVLALDIVLWTLASGAMLFIVKGRSPFFEAAKVSELFDQQGSGLQLDATKFNEVPFPDELSSDLHKTPSLSLGQQVKQFFKDDLKMHLPFFVLALVYVGIFVFNQSPSDNRNSPDEIAMNDDNAEVQSIIRNIKSNVPQDWKDERRVNTPQLERSFDSGARFDFSGCKGKTTTECIESATYAKTYFDGIEFNLGISRMESCGPEARFMTVFGPKGFTTTGCWVKNGAQINLWIFMPKDSNGNYMKVRGPVVQSVEVTPYYKTHSLPEL